MSSPRASAEPESRVEKPYFVFHSTFAEWGHAATYSGPTENLPGNGDAGYMVDEVTRAHARRMHYAAYRFSKARSATEAAKWKARYYETRDTIVLGNLKLVFRAVRQWMSKPQRADDLIGECQIVLIRAVAAYNPWLGIRFSTYAYTCLMRALSRLSQKQSNDWLVKALSLDSIPNGEPADGAVDDVSDAKRERLDRFLREDHPLLSAREKTILSRRFAFSGAGAPPTLETLGRDLGLSKERVRQVQALALDKLRHAIDVERRTI